MDQQQQSQQQQQQPSQPPPQQQQQTMQPPPPQQQQQQPPPPPQQQQPMQPPPPQQQPKPQQGPPGYPPGPYAVQQGGYYRGYPQHPPAQYPYPPAPYSFAPYPPPHQQQQHPSAYQPHQHPQAPQPPPHGYHQYGQHPQPVHYHPQDPYSMQYPPHYYPHHPQQMQPPPYAVGQPHAGGPPPMGPHPQGPHPQQAGPMYSPHPQSHPGPPPGHPHGPPPGHPHGPPQGHPQGPHPQQGGPIYSPHPSHPGHPQSHPQAHPVGVGQPHAGGPPPVMGPHPPGPHPQQAGPIYSPHPQSHAPPHGAPPHSPSHPHGPPQGHPQAHPQQGPGPMYSPHPHPHWVHGPHPQQPHPQQAPLPHPQQHPMMQHPPQQMPPQPGYYQPQQPPMPPQQQQPPLALPQPPPQQQLMPPSASPHLIPSRTHTPQQPMPPQQQQPPMPQQQQQQHPMQQQIQSQQQQPTLHPPTSQTPTRMQPTPNSTPASPANVQTKVDKKVDMPWPKNSVEATRPIPTKKRKITSKDVADIEVWRLVMCLKSGLLAESSWAIDVLSILLNDDSTLMYFGLQHTPGLLEAVLEHFKCCLNHLFDGLVSDTTLKPTKSAQEWVFNTVGYSHWQEGNGEDTSHIQIYYDNFIETSRRCTCISTIFRNLSFVPGNDVEMSKHAGLLLVLGRLLLLKHDIYNEVDAAPNEWHLLTSLREDALVIISNISSSLDLSPYNDKINLSLLDGLLHWACSSSSYALDPSPSPSFTVSPQRLALESLAKLSIIEGNVDLILATPPWSRIEKLFEVLTRLLNINEDQTVREFSLVLLSNLTSADSGIARKVALTGAAIPHLLSFLETSLADLENFSTTQDMLRRAASTLKCLSQLVDNHPLFAQHQQRLLNLVMSQKLDPEVVPIIADVIFEVSLSD